MGFEGLNCRAILIIGIPSYLFRGETVHQSFMAHKTHYSTDKAVRALGCEVCRGVFA